jgi:hypothetical protein
MSELLDEAIMAVRRLDPASRDAIARAMLALASDDLRQDSSDLDFIRKGGHPPTEAEITELMKTVMPSAVPTEAEVIAWNRLTADEQRARLRRALDHPDCKRISTATIDDIIAEGRAKAAQLRNA